MAQGQSSRGNQAGKEEMSWGAGRRDDSESAIAGALVKAGCEVDYAVRKPYDLLVSRAGVNYILECKSRSGKLTESQVQFRERWKGPYAVVRSAAEALKAVGL